MSHRLLFRLAWRSHSRHVLFPSPRISLLSTSPVLGARKVFTSAAQPRISSTATTFRSAAWVAGIGSVGACLTAYVCIAEAKGKESVIPVVLAREQTGKKARLQAVADKAKATSGTSEGGGKEPVGNELLLDQMKPDAWLYVLAAVASILSSFFMTSQAKVFGSFFDIVGRKDSLRLLLDPVQRLVMYFAAQALLSFASSVALALAANRLATRLRSQFFATAMTLDIEFFDVNKTGAITHQLTEDIGALQSTIRSSFTRGIEGITSLVTGSVYLYLASPKLALCMFSILPVMSLAANGFGILLRRLSEDVRNATAKATGKATESIASIRTVRSFGGEQMEVDQYKQALEEVIELKRVMSLAAGGFYAMLGFGINMIALLICGYGGYLVEQGELTRGGIAAIATQVQMLERSIARLSMLNAQVVKALRAADHVFDVMNLVPKVNTPVGGLGILLDKAEVRGDVTFDAVKFVYPNRPESPVLQGFDLQVNAGQVVALVGPSGSGKSTVTALLERFYDTTDGVIRVDGVDVRDIHPDSLHTIVGTVAQEPVLFATSILENIRYGKPDATEAEVIEAAKKANAHYFIDGLPDGYNTVLGERGSLLSGGQKQRVAIARAILSDPKILILDEATSALDTRSEQLVQAALSELMKGRTTIVVAHRLTTIKDADIICVVQDGRIIEKGSHADLVHVPEGHYRSLFRRQHSRTI